ncbi:MAG: hypothetical protein COB54_00870 [Alphaproteobacteria bacterium]|nr:MAG: hypothetical protein COB54_00870 [Alphaproteobacteria bacterium]
MSILKRLSNMLKESPVEAPQKVENEKLAAAVLMVEVAAHDGEISRVEREHILHLLENKLGLSEAEALELFVEAIATQNDANHILSFTRKIKDHFDEAGRQHILELMWEVVFADGKEDLYESNLLRRVTGLLYISDKQSGQIKKKVKARLGLN